VHDASRFAERAEWGQRIEGLMMETAAALVKRMRTRRQLTRTALADLARVPASTITRIESGEMDPTFGMLQRIAAAAGYAWGDFSDSGSDDAIAAQVESFETSPRRERNQIAKKMTRTASVSPVAKRRGVQRYELAGSLSEFVEELKRRGSEPVISSLEAAAGNASDMLSFSPIVYVDTPSALADLPKATPTSKSAVFVLPMTDNARRFIRSDDRTMMVPTWGLLDALASPGRQAEVAESFLPELVNA
jgi:transcriptional regulator with XRE-family HTH domain